jgi:hypothetical protein
MQFKSISFIFCFSSDCTGSYLASREKRFANFFMLLASLYFFVMIPHSVLRHDIARFFRRPIDRERQRLAIPQAHARAQGRRQPRPISLADQRFVPQASFLWSTLTPIALSLPPTISFYTFHSSR